METRQPMVNRRHALLLARARTFARDRARLARERAHKIARAIHPRIRALPHPHPSARPLTRAHTHSPTRGPQQSPSRRQLQCARAGMFGDARGHSRPVGISVVRCGSHAAARCTAHAAVHVNAIFRRWRCTPTLPRQRACPFARHSARVHTRSVDRIARREPTHSRAKPPISRSPQMSDL